MKSKKVERLSKRPLYLTLLVILALFIASCTDDIDITSPKIEISSPNNGEVFTVSEMIEVVGRVTDDIALESLNVSSNLGISESFTEFSEPTDIPFNLPITLDQVTAMGDYSIVFLATDTAGNTAEEVVNIVIQ